MYRNESLAADGRPATFTWIPIMCLFLFYACSTIGYLIVPWVMIGEVFPRQIRGMMGGMSTCVGHFSIFIVVQTYPFLQDAVSKPGTFAMYGALSLTSTLFFYYFCPETKGKSLQEIEESFIKKKKPKAIACNGTTGDANRALAEPVAIAAIEDGARGRDNDNAHFAFPDIVNNLPKRVPANMIV